MAEGRVPEIVAERNRLHQIFIQRQRPRHRARNLRDFEGVRQTRAEMITVGDEKNLPFVFEPAKRPRVNNAIAIALKRRAILVLVFRKPAGGVGANAAARIRREPLRFEFLPVGGGAEGEVNSHKSGSMIRLHYAANS